MKFCKNLQRIADISDPEWAPYWTNYKMLKKLIKELPCHVPADDSFTATSSSNCLKSRSSSFSSSSSVPSTIFKIQQNGDRTEDLKPNINENKQVKVTKDMGNSPGEVAFFKFLRAELKKVSYFFERAQREFAIREERVREGLEIMSRPTSIMVSEKWSYLAKSLYKLYKDLLLLETFAIMSYCSFSKILKKHDKVTGYKTRMAFMSNVVNKANFANYPKVLEMISRCESSYKEVSRYLAEEGKADLYDEHRLFINTIERFHKQIIDKADEEDAPDVYKLREQHKKRKSLGACFAPVQNSKCKDARALRSLVEENEADKESVSGSTCLSDDPEGACLTDERTESFKRKRI